MAQISLPMVSLTTEILNRDRFHFANFVKCKRTILKPISLHWYPRSERERKFAVARLSPPKNVKLGIFTSSSCSDGKDMYKKACCTYRVVIFFLVADADAVVESLNVMLHETIRNDDFQHNTVFKWWNNVAAFETMSQQCY